VQEKQPMFEGLLKDIWGEIEGVIEVI